MMGLAGFNTASPCFFNGMGMVFETKRPARTLFVQVMACA